MYFFFNDTATTEIYTLSLHDALPISVRFGAEQTTVGFQPIAPQGGIVDRLALPVPGELRSEEHTSELQSHSFISYAVFCLKKKTEKDTNSQRADQYNPKHKIVRICTFHVSRVATAPAV